MPEVVEEFSRFASQYDSYSIIQAQVAKTLVEMIPFGHQTTILDIGCGSGMVYKNIMELTRSFDNFIALDFSPQMLALHPCATNIEKIEADFNSFHAFKNISLGEGGVVLSSSALQWCKDLDFTLAQIAQIPCQVYFAIFTANTFKTLHQVAGITSPIYPQSILKDTIQKYYHASFETKEYRLEFGSAREMFRYIKKSGVSGRERKLTYKQTKALMESYTLNYLEFEVLFVKGDIFESKTT